MLSPIEKRNLGLFLRNARLAVNDMANQTKYPELRVIYERIADNLAHVPLNIKPGSDLSSNGFSTIFGENVKKFDGGSLQSAIRIPHDHLFDPYGNIRSDGALTLLHEESHVILPRSAQMFTARVGLAPEHADEFFADVLSAHVARKIGFTRDTIGNHLRQRRSYFGFPIDRFALEGRRGVAKEIEAGRFVPRATRRPEPRDPFRTPTEPQHILPGRPEGPPSWLPGLGKGGRRPLKEFNRRI